VQTAVTMRQVTGSMTNVVRGMDQAMKAMDLEKVGPSAILKLHCISFTDQCCGLDLSSHGSL
jgi:hypothetical protein